MYHPAQCIYEDPRNNECLTKRDAKVFEFRFMEGPPGWDVLGLSRTVESIVSISPNGHQVSAKNNQEINEVSLPRLPERLRILNRIYDSRSKSAKPESLSIANIAALRYTSCKVTAGKDLYCRSKTVLPSATNEAPK